MTNMNGRRDFSMDGSSERSNRHDIPRRSEALQPGNDKTDGIYSLALVRQLFKRKTVEVTMSRRACAAALCVIVSAPIIVSAREPRQTAQVTGTITYRERVALSPSTVVDVRLDDVTRPGTGESGCAG